MIRTWLAFLGAVIVSVSLSYSATVVSIRFLDMQHKIEKTDVCQNTYANALTEILPTTKKGK